MKFVSYQLEYSEIDDFITIPLAEPYYGYVGLSEIFIPGLADAKNQKIDSINITCDQIDSTFDNPDRLLRHIPILRNQRRLEMWTAHHIHLKKVDSDDKFLTIRLRRISPDTRLSVAANKDAAIIWLTLVFADENEHHNWFNSIKCI